MQQQVRFERQRQILAKTMGMRNIQADQISQCTMAMMNYQKMMQKHYEVRKQANMLCYKLHILQTY